MVYGLSIKTGFGSIEGLKSFIQKSIQKVKRSNVVYGLSIKTGFGSIEGLKSFS